MRIKNILFRIMVIMLITMISSKGYCQDEVEMIYPYFDLVYLKDSDNQKNLNARIYYETETGVKALPGLSIKFYTNSENPTLLGEVVSDIKGWAKLALDESVELVTDDDNSWWFSAEFEGNETVEMVSSETAVTDVMLDMTLNDDESGNWSVTLNAYTIVDGEQVPVSGEDVYLFVPRMFSMLTVGTGTLDEGEVTIDFQNGIPGDSIGVLTVVGKFSDHWQYGNVEKVAEVQWGVPSSHEVAESHRALWTQIAPTWMIVTLSIMLVGVWGHYFFAIISIVRIGREGKRIKNEA